MLARPGAPMNRATVSKDSSNSAVICWEAVDCPRCTFSYPGASDRYRASSSRGGWVLAALFVAIRPASPNVKCLRIARTSSEPGVMAIMPRRREEAAWAGPWESRPLLALPGADQQRPGHRGACEAD